MERLREIIPRQLFEVRIRAAIGQKGIGSVELPQEASLSVLKIGE